MLWETCRQDRGTDMLGVTCRQDRGTDMLGEICRQDRGTDMLGLTCWQDRGTDMLGETCRQDGRQNTDTYCKTSRVGNGEWIYLDRREINSYRRLLVLNNLQ